MEGKKVSRSVFNLQTILDFACFFWQKYIAKIKIHFSFFPVLLVIFFFGKIEVYAYALIFAGIHELTHTIIASKYEVFCEEIILSPIGFCAKLSGVWKTQSKDELRILLAGPASNIFFAILFFILCILSQGWLAQKASIIFQINIFLALFNLLPMNPLDGGKILFVLVSRNISIMKSQQFCYQISLVIYIFFAFLSISFFILSFNPIFLMILCFIAYSLYENKNIAKAEAFLYIIGKKFFLENRDVNRIKNIVVGERTKLLDVIKEINREETLMAWVMNEKKEVIGLISEPQLIEECMRSDPLKKVEKILNE